MLHHKGALVMTVDRPDLILSVLPNARHIRHKGKELVLVKHSLDATKVLRNMGMDAPTPMLYDGYGWPGRYDPMSHQIQTADFLTMNFKAFVLNATGTGKTGAAIWAMEYLIQRGFIRRILIVCPLSVIKVWQDELFNLVPQRTLGILTGSRSKRLDVLNSNVEIAIINFDGVTSLFHNDKKKRKKSSELEDKFDLILVDEASTYRNVDTERYQALQYINKPNVRLWMLTGTPTPNAPTDAWGLVRLVSPGRVPASFNLFRETVMQPAGPYKWVAKIGAAQTVRDVMLPAVRFEKKDCLDLPPLTYNDRYCEMSVDQKRSFEVMKRKLKDETEHGNTITAANAAVKILKMQQICCGVVKDDDQNPVYLNPTSRLKLVHELVEQAPDKVIVFVPFIYSMHMVKEHLESKDVNCALVNGEVSANARSEIFTAFQRDENPRVLIAHPKVAAHGLTLTAASTIIWYAPIYSLEEYEQANARIERQGQKNVMSVYHIITHPFEAAIYQVLQKKGSVQAALLTLYKQVTA